MIVCDSVGCGEAPDAEDFGDLGANTLAHVVAAESPRLPHLASLGIDRIPGVPDLAGGVPRGAYGRMIERAPAKDTMAGHWELMGVISTGVLPTYPDGFPDEVIDEFERATGVGVLGNRTASGTEVIDAFGEEHRRTGFPILYTSADSVFQLAAHEEIVPVARLYEMCIVARGILQGRHGVGRVIARPFVGAERNTFQRTARRRDFPLLPPAPPALDALAEEGVRVHAVGKINDIFAGRGIQSFRKTADNADGVNATVEAMRGDSADLIFTNLVDFDSRFGHRNDPAGYARALEKLDAAVPRLLGALGPEDALVLTADHGNDPTTPGTDHTREQVPLLVAGPRVRPVDLGTRTTFADLAATILANFGVEVEGPGTSFLQDLTMIRDPR